jgi:KDO2-lipid IV(A) lauroyltransferase
MLHNALDVLGSGLVIGMGKLSHRAALRCGAAVGVMSGSLLLRKRRRIRANLARAGVPNPGRAGWRAWRQVGANVFEILWLLGRGPDDPQIRLQIEGVDDLRGAAREGKGVLLVSAHLGNWEFVPLAAALSGLEVAVVARPLAARRLQRRWIAFRQRCGVRTFLRGEAGVGMAAARWLRRGAVLGCMMDRTAQTRRMLVPFLGEGMHMPLGPIELATRGGTAVVLGVAQRQLSGGTSVHFRRLPSMWGRTVAESARKIAASLEDEVRRRPEDWLWIYRRQAYLGPAAERAAGD